MAGGESTHLGGEHLGQEAGLARSSLADETDARLAEGSAFQEVGNLIGLLRGDELIENT